MTGVRLLNVKLYGTQTCQPMQILVDDWLIVLSEPNRTTSHLAQNCLIRLLQLSSSKANFMCPSVDRVTAPTTVSESNSFEESRACMSIYMLVDVDSVNTS